jgi:GrpE
LKHFFQKRGGKVPDKDSPFSTEGRAENAGADPSDEAKLSADSAAADAEVAKIAGELNELRQTLMRRQADFDNYRKRIEKERADDAKRSTARVVESLIPIIDWRIAKPSTKATARASSSFTGSSWITSLASASSAPTRSASNLTRTCIKRWTARKLWIRKTAQFCRYFSLVMFFMAECYGRRWSE